MSRLNALFVANSSAWKEEKNLTSFLILEMGGNKCLNEFGNLSLNNNAFYLHTVTLHFFCMLFLMSTCLSVLCLMPVPIHSVTDLAPICKKRRMILLACMQYNLSALLIRTECRRKIKADFIFNVTFYVYLYFVYTCISCLKFEKFSLRIRINVCTVQYTVQYTVLLRGFLLFFLSKVVIAHFRSVHAQCVLPRTLSTHNTFPHTQKVSFLFFCKVCNAVYAMNKKFIQNYYMYQGIAKKVY